MFLDFFLDLKKVKIPVSLNEYFNFLEALKKGLSLFDLNSFYYLARSSLIKDEKLEFTDARKFLALIRDTFSPLNIAKSALQNIISTV